MNKRTEIINEKPYDPGENQDHSENVVFIGHCKIVFANSLKNKGIPGFRQFVYIINAKHYTIYPLIRWY